MCVCVCALLEWCVCVFIVPLVCVYLSGVCVLLPQWFMCVCEYLRGVHSTLVGCWSLYNSSVMYVCVCVSGHVCVHYLSHVSITSVICSHCLSGVCVCVCVGTCVYITLVMYPLPQ